MRRAGALLWAVLLVLPVQGRAAGNTNNESFAKAKRLLEQEVYYDHRQTLYCGAVFDEHKRVQLPQGFTTDKHRKRSLRVEWEHVVPAENFQNGGKVTPVASTARAKPFGGGRVRKK